MPDVQGRIPVVILGNFISVLNVNGSVFTIPSNALPEEFLSEMEVELNCMGHI